MGKIYLTPFTYQSISFCCKNVLLLKDFLERVENFEDGSFMDLFYFFDVRNDTGDQRCKAFVVRDVPT